MMNTTYSILAMISDKEKIEVKLKLMLLSL